MRKIIDWELIKFIRTKISTLSNSAPTADKRVKPITIQFFLFKTHTHTDQIKLKLVH